MTEASSPQQPDDWQALAAQHRQEQFASKVTRLDKQARRGNRMIGGCLMVCGVLALFGGLVMAAQMVAGDLEITIRTLRGIYGFVGGGAVTALIGWAIWRHRNPRPQPDPITDKVKATLD